MARIRAQEGPSRKFRPVTIPVRVRASMNGNNTLKGLEPLNYRKADMDVEMTWVEAFAHYFDFHIDPDKYLIQLGTNQPCKRGKGVKVGRHSLNEKIKVLKYEGFRKEFRRNINHDGYSVALLLKTKDVKNIWSDDTPAPTGNQPSITKWLIKTPPPQSPAISN